MKKRNVFLMAAVVALVVTQMGCRIFGYSFFEKVEDTQIQTPYVGDMTSESQGEQVKEWEDEDGFAHVGDPSTERFYPWVFEDFIPQEFPGARVVDYGTWRQAILPDGTIISGSEWGEESLYMNQVDGLSDGKSVFVAMRDFEDWVNDPDAAHLECTGTLISSYDSARMGNWPVHNSTIIQIENGNALSFVRKLDEKWSAVRVNVGGCP